MLLISLGLIGVGLSERLPAPSHVSGGGGATAAQPSLGAWNAPGLGSPSPAAPPPEEDRLVVVPAGEALSIAVPEIGFDAPAGLLKVGNTGVITPPDFEQVFRVADRGTQPGTMANDTVYYACHTHSRRSAEQVPCNMLQAKLREGHHIVVATAGGVLTYLVTNVRQVPKSDLAEDFDVWDVAPGRLIWITCLYEPGHTTGFNLVITAEIQDEYQPVT